MGTNFYAIRRIKREDKDKLIEKAKELEEVIEKLSAYSVKTAVEDILEFLEGKSRTSAGIFCKNDRGI